MGSQNQDGSVTSPSDGLLVVLIPGVWVPWSMLDWKQIEDYLSYLGVEHVTVEPGRGKKWCALFVPGRRPALANYLADQIGSKLKALPKEPGAAVIAHSFGTVILAQMLQELCRSQSLGRVVLFGSVLRPNFPWHGYLKDYSNQWSLKDLRNVIGERDGILKWLAPIAALVERFVIYWCGGEPMIGQAGLTGFTCDREKASSLCKDHNSFYSNVEYEGRRYPLGRHSTPLNALDIPTWFYFLGVWPRFQGLQFIDEVRLAARDESVPWRPVDTIFEFLRNRETRAILVEGDKGTGKSYAAILAARKLYAHKAHDNQPIYYLDGGTVVDRHTRDTIQGSIERLPLGATLLMDDLHRSKEALDLALKALDISKVHLLFVSRPLRSEEKYQRLFRACKERKNCHRFPMPTVETARADVCDLIRAALDRRLHEFSTPAAGITQIQIGGATVSAFCRCFPDNLADLFDAIAAWEPNKPITNALADEAIKTKWQHDPDFCRGLRPGDSGVVPSWYEQALAALIVVATWWQFERPTSQAALPCLFGVSFDVTRDLESRGVLRPVSRPTAGYSLDHESRARRYVRVAASDPMFTAHLTKKFSTYSLALPPDAAGLTDYILMLEILDKRDGQEQAKYFREQIHDPLVFRGYGFELLRIITTLGNHLDKLEPPARVQVLTDGGGIRRRFDSLDEAQIWLERAERLAREHGIVDKLGGILYERAYVCYLNYDFDGASRIFEESASLSRSFWQDVSKAKAAEARFQHAMRGDHFNRNLNPTRVLGQTLTRTLEEVRQTLATKRTALDGFKDEGALRWACRLHLHLADLCLETGDDGEAQKHLDASEQTVRAQYPAFEPVLEYLSGRLALIAQRPSDALVHLEQALEGYDAGVREDEGLGDLLIALGDTHRQRKEWDKTREYYGRAQHVDDKRKNGHARAVAAAVVRLLECAENSM